MSDAAQLSVQLYTVRDALAEDFDGTLAKIAGFGYTQVEPFAFTNFTDELKAGLGKHGLAAPTTHVGLLDGDQEEIFAAAKELGIGTVIEPAVREPHWQTEEDIAATAQQLNAAAERGRRARAAGRLPQPLVGDRARLRRPARAGGAGRAPGAGGGARGRHLLGVVGGADVPALLGRLGDRVVALHIKDGDGTRDTKKQVPLGSGSIPDLGLRRRRAGRAAGGRARRQRGATCSTRSGRATPTSPAST